MEAYKKINDMLKKVYMDRRSNKKMNIAIRTCCSKRQTSTLKCWNFGWVKSEEVFGKDLKKQSNFIALGAFKEKGVYSVSKKASQYFYLIAFIHII